MAHRGRGYLAQPTGEPRMTTVVKPRRNGYPTGYQFSAPDYVSVPALTTHGKWSLAELCTFTVGANTDARNVDLVIEVSERAVRRGEEIK